MVASTIIREFGRYLAPPQYALQGVGLAAGYLNANYPLGYVPFNGWRPALYAPNATRRFSGGEGTVASAPADLSTFIITGPDSQLYKFQFVRAGSVATTGIPIAVPAGGGTAAQTMAAIVAAFNAGVGVETDTGRTRYLPLKATPGVGGVFNWNYTVAGNGFPISGTQVTITATYAQAALLGQALPGRVGPCGTFQCGST